MGPSPILSVITAHKRSLRRLCFYTCWDTNPGTRHPPGTRYPPGTRHSPAQCMLGDTVNKRTVCILLECHLVHTVIIGAVPNLNGDVNGHGPKNVTCEQTLTSNLRLLKEWKHNGGARVLNLMEIWEMIVANELYYSFISIHQNHVLGGTVNLIDQFTSFFLDDEYSDERISNL